MAARRQLCTAVKYPNVVETEKATLEDVVAFLVFAIDPPSEIDEQLVEDAFEKSAVGVAGAFAFNGVDAPGRPGVHRRIDVTKGPFVSRYLPVRMHIPFA